MFPATIPHAPPINTPPFYHHIPPSNHLPSPQNHSPPPENHHQQNSSLSHTQHLSHPPMENLKFFLQKMAENQANHQQEVVQLLHSLIPTLPTQQITHSSVQEGVSSVSAFSAKNAENLLCCSQDPVQCVPAVKTAAQPTTQATNAIFRSTMPVTTVTTPSSSFSPVEGSFQAKNSSHNAVLVQGKDFNDANMSKYGHYITTGQITPFTNNAAEIPSNSAENMHTMVLPSIHHPPQVQTVLPMPSNPTFKPSKDAQCSPPHNSNAFASNVQTHHSLQPLFYTQPFYADGNVNSGIPEQNHQQKQPTVSIQQNSSLPNGPLGLSAETAVAEPVLPAFSVSSAPVISATSAAQGSMPATSSLSPFNNTIFPACSPNTWNLVTTSHPQHISSSFPTSTANCIGSPSFPNSSDPISTTQTFASLFNQSHCSSPVILPPLPTPYFKGNLPAIKLNETLYQNSIAACQLNLIGRISLPKGASPLTCHALHTKLNNAWNTQKSFTITPIGKGFYCLRFGNKEDQNKAWLFGTLNLKPGSFRLQPWSNDFNPAQQKQTTYHVWVRLHEVSQEYWDPHLLISIASLVGTPKAFDPSTKALTFGHYARLQVEVDLMHSLPSRLLVEREGHSFEVPVTYESLPKFCQHCHNIGHLVSECNSLRKIQAVHHNDRSRTDNNKVLLHQAKQSKTVVKANSGQNNAPQHASSSNNEVCYAIHVDAANAEAINLAIQDVFGPPSPHSEPHPHINQQTPLHSPIANASDPIHSSCVGHKQQPLSPLVDSFVPCSINQTSNKSSTSKTANKSSSSFYKKTPTPSPSRPLHQTHAQPLPFTSSNKYSLLREHYLDGDGDGEAWDHFSDENSMENEDEFTGFYSPAGTNQCFPMSPPKLNVNEALHWDTMAEEEPFQSWEARADAEFEAAIAASSHRVDCAQLEQDNRSSVLEQDFPPLQAPHRSVPSPVQTRAQRLRNGTQFYYTRKKKQSKAAKREALHVNGAHGQQKVVAAMMNSAPDSHGQVATIVKDAVSTEQAHPLHVNEGWKVTIHPHAQQIKTARLCNTSISCHKDSTINLAAIHEQDYHS